MQDFHCVPVQQSLKSVLVDYPVSPRENRVLLPEDF